jgi:hypothetical protein
VQTALNGTALNGHAIVEDPSGIPSHSTKTYTTADLTDAEFRKVWPQGSPLVMTGLGEKFGIRWRPDHFRDKHGSQTCSIVECQTDASKRITISEFFGYFGKYEGHSSLREHTDEQQLATVASVYPIGTHPPVIASSLSVDHPHGSPQPLRTRGLNRSFRSRASDRFSIITTSRDSIRATRGQPSRLPRATHRQFGRGPDPSRSRERPTRPSSRPNTPSTRPHTRTEHWRLKDWPSSSDFKTALPDVFEEFQKGVPMPNYTRKDGVLNIASHFPSNTVMPDLGT